MTGTISSLFSVHFFSLLWYFDSVWVIYQPRFSICHCLPKAAVSPLFPPLFFFLSEIFPNLMFHLDLLELFCLALCLGSF
jgi:hypothetical protein